ncbi:MAG: type II secretion system protein GspK [Pirellulaceae bacterium]
MTQRNMVRTKSNLRCRNKHKLSGIILVVVLVVIAMLALAAYTFTDLMLTEKEAALLNGHQIQARNLVDSGVEQVKVYLEMTEDVRYASGGEFDNPALFQAVQVTTGVNATARGRFTVISPMMDSQGMWGGVRFGLEDESGRLNLNALDLALPDEEDADAAALEAAVDDILDSGGNDTNDGTAGVGNATGGAVPSGANSGGGTTGGATSGGTSGGTNDADDAASDDSTDEEEEEPIDTSGRAMLMKLPGMTVDIADAILDYVDEDDEPREYGAESSYYSSLSYAAKNGPLETVEELLMVRGVTPDLLFGRDINRNGIIDMHELNLPLTGGFDDGTGAMDRGWSAYLTLFSAERNVNQEGLPKVNLNEEDLQTLHDQLTQVFSDPGWATFIVAYRQNGPDSNESTAAEAEAPSDQAVDFSRPARFPSRKCWIW